MRDTLAPDSEPELSEPPELSELDSDPDASEPDAESELDSEPESSEPELPILDVLEPDVEPEL